MKSTVHGLIDAIRNSTPVPYVSRGGISLPWRTPGGAATQMQAMGSVGTLFNIVSTTSQAAAEVEWKLYRKSSTGNPNDRTEVTSHPALDLWNHPNKHMTRQELVEVVQQHIDLTGEGWIVVGRNPRVRAIPLELWPVRPDQMSPQPSPTDFISGYWFAGPDGQPMPLPVDDVLFMRMPRPMDNYRGMAPVESVMTDLDAAQYAAQWNRNFFLNSAQPGGIIEVDKRLTDDEFNEMVARWREQHQGVANAHRVAVIEQGKWISNNYTVHDMQFVQLSGLSKEKIREAYGFPKFAAGEVDDVNRATAEASSAWFARRLTVPRLTRWKAMLNNDLLPLFGRDAAKTYEFDYISPVMEDRDANNAERDSQTKALQTLKDAGVEIDGRVLSWLGLPPTWKMAEPEEPPPAPIQATATVGEPVEAIEEGPRNAGDSFLQVVGRFRAAQELLNHPGHGDQKSHGRKGVGTLHETDESLHATFNYTDGPTGMSATVRKIIRTDETVFVSIEIRDRDGAKVGESLRTINMGQPTTVNHDMLTLDPSIQGQGFAARFNAHAEQAYRDHGITKIELRANVDVGGYAWSRAGYEFKTGRDRARIAKHATDVAARHLTPDVQAQVARVAANPHASPIDFAMIGHTPGATTWAGKEIMLGTTWDGVKTL